MKTHNNIIRYKGMAFFPLFLLAILLLPTSCSDDDPISTAGPDDNPMIISPVFPDRVNGELPTISTFYRDSAFVYSVIVTPHDYTTVTWNIDGEKVAEGDSININLPAGIYDLKIDATTVTGKSTSREGLVKVLPATGDPYSEAKGYERIIAPGKPAVIYGDNLAGVKNIVIGGQSVPATYNESDKSLSYSVPKSLSDGTYRMLLEEASGNQFGANTVQVSSNPLIISGADRFGANSTVTITGINLDKIVSLTIGDNTITDFTSKSDTELTFTSPDLVVGDYVITGKTNDGTAVLFYSAKGNTTQNNLTITAETTLWEGHHYVSWDYADGDPHKTFNLIDQDVFANIKPGTTLKVYYSVEPSAEYHQMQITDGWWGPLPSTQPKYEFSSDGVIEMTILQADLDAIRDHNGFLCVGHGYYVDRVTTK